MTHAIRTILVLSAFAGFVVMIPRALGQDSGSPGPKTSAPPEVEKAMQMPEGKEKNAALGAAMKAWAQKDATAGLAWALALSPPQYGQVRGSLAVFAQGAKPASSADWLVQQGSPTALDALHGMLISWAVNDADSASAWCVGLKAKDAKARSVSFFSVADGLCRKKAEAATAWVAQLQPGDDRLAAVEGTTIIWARGDIVAATGWIKTLSAAEVKRAAQTVVSVWRFAKGTSKSPNMWQNVQEWLDQLPLSAAEKDYVLKNPRR
jgi:hypothetical protein